MTLGKNMREIIFFEFKDSQITVKNVLLEQVFHFGHLHVFKNVCNYLVLCVDDFNCKLFTFNSTGALLKTTSLQNKYISDASRPYEIAVLFSEITSESYVS